LPKKRETGCLDSCLFMRTNWFDLLQATCSVTRECAISRGSFGLGRDCSFER
jgi:hypothetical protein